MALFKAGHIRIDRSSHALALLNLLVAAMPPISKLRLSILLLFLQLFLYLYVVPRGNGAAKQEDPGGGFLLERACRLSYPPTEESISGGVFFLELADNCGIRKEQPPPPPPPPPVIEEPQVHVEPEPEAPRLAPEPSNQEPAKPTVQESRSGNLIYQIIMVLLFLSVSFALADCFQERAKKRANPDRHDGLSRRMSLADLTMSRHARRESQASYRPIGVKRQPLATRSCSHEIPMKTKSVFRQASCPLLDEDVTTERRRVRMIQRH